MKIHQMLDKLVLIEDDRADLKEINSKNEMIDAIQNSFWKIAKFYHPYKGKIVIWDQIKDILLRDNYPAEQNIENNIKNFIIKEEEEITEDERKLVLDVCARCKYNLKNIEDHVEKYKNIDYLKLVREELIRSIEGMTTPFSYSKWIDQDVFLPQHVFQSEDKFGDNALIIKYNWITKGLPDGEDSFPSSSFDEFSYAEIWHITATYENYRDKYLKSDAVLDENSSDGQFLKFAFAVYQKRHEVFINYHDCFVALHEAFIKYHEPLVAPYADFSIHNFWYKWRVFYLKTFGKEELDNYPYRYALGTGDFTDVLDANKLYNPLKWIIAAIAFLVASLYALFSVIFSKVSHHPSIVLLLFVIVSCIPYAGCYFFMLPGVLPMLAIIANPVNQVVKPFAEKFSLSFLSAASLLALSIGAALFIISSCSITNVLLIIMLTIRMLAMYTYMEFLYILYQHDRNQFWQEFLFTFIPSLNVDSVTFHLSTTSGLLSNLLYYVVYILLFKEMQNFLSPYNLEREASEELPFPEHKKISDRTLRDLYPHHLKGSISRRYFNTPARDNKETPSHTFNKFPMSRAYA